MRYRYAPFVTWLIVAAIAAGVGSWVRGCRMESRTAMIGTMEAARHRHGRDIAMIEGIEGRKPGSPLDLVAKQVRALADAKRPGESAKEAVELASVVKPLSGKQLDRLGTMDRWLPYKTLAHMPAFEDFRALSDRYDLAPALFGKRDLSARLTPPEAPPPPLTFFGSAWHWLLVYLIGCGSFVILWIVGALMEEDHPLTSIRWTHPAPLLTAAMTAPAFAAALVIGGTGYGVYRVFRDGERAVTSASAALGRFGSWARRTAYQLRLIRRLPAPAVAPLPVSVPVAPPRAAEAPLAAVGDPPPSGWVVVDPRVTLGRKRLLAERGIEIFPISIAVPRALEGHAVTEASIEAFEDALGLADVEAQDETTDVEGATFREYDYGSGDVRIARLEKEGLRAAIMTALQEASAEDGGTDVTFIECDGWERPPDGTAHGAWRAYAYCAPERSVAIDCGRLYGMPFDERTLRLEPRGPGIVVHDAEGVPVAQVVGREVYVLVDLLRLGACGKVALMQECLARALIDAFEARGPDLVQSDERLRAALEAEKDEHRRRYVETCLTRVEAEKAEIAKGIAECEEAVRKAGKAITRQLKARRELEIRRKDLESGAWREELERLGREFDALAASKVVAAIRADGDRVAVETTAVRIRHEGKTYLIGRFRLSLHVDGGIRIENIENAGRSRVADHPHVTEGRACFGNITEAIAKYMAAREYATVVALLHRYLASYNPASPLTKIDNWPTVKECA